MKATVMLPCVNRSDSSRLPGTGQGCVRDTRQGTHGPALLSCAFEELKAGPGAQPAAPEEGRPLQETCVPGEAVRPPPPGCREGDSRGGPRGGGGADAACTCADGPLTRKSVGGSGSRGAGPGPSRAAVPAVPGPASPRDFVQYLSLVLVAASAVCRGRAGCARSGLLPGGWEAPVQCGPVAVRPRLPQSELKPCRCLTYSGLSSPVVSTMRTWSCGLAAAGTSQAAPAPCSGTCKSSSNLSSG
ncbi:uncharacterized protein LOC115948245 [Geospiza fortis]|uniref:Uncharacterized protein LOC115948245 n=1 Tax=Geospiza fortis TaxID=48883 RepID=A0A8N5I0G9_GEOFO|nr:uncharacterized protein LOC115948245 [Geospiza fortis]